jgi:hypothetical protein
MPTLVFDLDGTLVDRLRARVHRCDIPRGHVPCLAPDVAGTAMSFVTAFRGYVAGRPAAQGNGRSDLAAPATSRAWHRDVARNVCTAVP